MEDAPNSVVCEAREKIKDLISLAKHIENLLAEHCSAYPTLFVSSAEEESKQTTTVLN